MASDLSQTSVQVERCELAPGLTVSRVLTGLWQVADMERDGQTLELQAAADAMTPYAEAGLTSFDMADHYGSAEEIAGQFGSRSASGTPVQRLTKWVPSPGPVTKGNVRTAVERALRRLRTERLDLLQLHTWSYADPSWLDALFWLQELQAEGLVAHLGLTNVDTAHLRLVLASGIKVASNQVSFSLLDQRAALEMTALCLEQSVKLLAYGTVAGGFLTEHWVGRPEPAWESLETWSLLKYRRFIEAAGGWDAFQTLLQAAARVAKRHGVSVANVASRAILEQPAVGGVIIGARLGRSEHLRDTLRVFSFRLGEADRAELGAALANLSPIPGDCGDEYRKPPFLTAAGDLSHHVASVPPPYPSTTRADGRRVVLSGTPWEALAGYCRAVRVGERILVSGTTATHKDRVIGGTDAAAQLHFAVDKLEGALQSLGGRLEDVVRTRVYVRDLTDWEAVARAHGARFREIRPVNTLVQAGLVGSEYLVELEAEAVTT